MKERQFELTARRDSVEARRELCEDGLLPQDVACANGHRFPGSSPEALHVNTNGPNLLCPKCVANHLHNLGLPVLDFLKDDYPPSLEAP